MVQKLQVYVHVFHSEVSPIVLYEIKMRIFVKYIYTVVNSAFTFITRFILLEFHVMAVCFNTMTSSFYLFKSVIGNTSLG